MHTPIRPARRRLLRQPAAASPNTPVWRCPSHFLPTQLQRGESWARRWILGWSTRARRKPVAGSARGRAAGRAAEAGSKAHDGDLAHRRSVLPLGEPLSRKQSSRACWKQPSQPCGEASASSDRGLLERRLRKRRRQTATWPRDGAPGAKEVPNDALEVLEALARLCARVVEQEDGQLGPGVTQGGDGVRRACVGARGVAGGVGSLTSAVPNLVESLNDAKGCGKGEKDRRGGPRAGTGGTRREANAVHLGLLKYYLAMILLITRKSFGICIGYCGHPVCA